MLLPTIVSRVVKRGKNATDVFSSEPPKIVTPEQDLIRASWAGLVRWRPAGRGEAAGCRSARRRGSRVGPIPGQPAAPGPQGLGS